MKSVLDRFFLARIDRALDDAEALRGWTAWYVRRRPDLWNYYETMLQMELELRFPDSECDVSTEIPTPVRLETVREVDTNSSARRDRLFVYSAIAILFLALTLFFLAPGKRIVPDIPIGPQTPEFAVVHPVESSRIDLAELLSIAEPVAKSVLPENSPFELEWSRPSERFSFPVESIVGFSEKPIESTLSFLEQARIFEKHSFDKESL